MARQMRTISPWRLGSIVFVTTVLGWLAATWAGRVGWPAPSLPYSALITLGIVSVGVFLLGWRVRSWRENRSRARQEGSRAPAKARPLDPILAARTLILAQASCYAGALLMGWHLGVVVDALSAVVGYGAPLTLVIQPAVLLGGAAVVVAVGLLVERFCRIPPDTPEDPDKAGARPVQDDGGEYAR
ncbi:DUF3180 domain-containing protein [Psychromicrobium xiongbiense]|uniref:DUF3180 domain-containing protein n=1 Tax=Psychromicrobium xiongbiense TaxID=3051184 RepID=UPI002556CAB2|nr:DUF3180 domain-containing protein [Psychromicrobium sp. YIM S02556]